MKGMLDLLERAGLVRRVGDDETPAAAEGAGAADSEPTRAAESAAASGGAANAAVRAAPAAAGPADAPAEATALALEEVYARASVAPCVYPAERLLRLIDGLKAMDEPMRRTTIQAIDAADDSWSIDDPMRDAAAKVAAIERHAATIRAGVAQAEQQTQAELAALQQRQEATVAEVRRQVADLEGLLAREVARGAQGAAALESALQSQRQNAQRELDALARAAGELSSLMAQYSPAAKPE
jgi:hypothetical protein